MNWIPERLRNCRLFMIMFLISVVMIMIVSVAITWTMINMSEKFFIEKFSIMNKKVIGGCHN